MQYKIKKGMEVYCDLHARSHTHKVKRVDEKRGWVELEDGFAWPLHSCFPKDEVTLPTKEYADRIHELYG